MDPDCSICKERASPMLFADTKRSYQTKRPLCVIYSLLVLSYLLILTLFVLVLYRTQGTFSRKTEDQLTHHVEGIDDIQTQEKVNVSRKPEDQLNNHTNDIGLVKKQVNEISILLPEYVANVKKLQNQVEDLSSRFNNTDITTEKMSCETGWIFFNDRCYFFSMTSSDWSEARDACKTKGADLVAINSIVEQRFILSEIASKEFRRYWIGLHDMDKETQWQWVDGTDYETSYKNWDTGEPNDADDNEDCVHTQYNGKWNDVHCTFSTNVYGICERKL